MSTIIRTGGGGSSDLLDSYYSNGKICKFDQTLNNGTGIWALSTADVTLEGSGGIYSGTYYGPFIHQYAEWAYANTLYFTFKAPVEIVGFSHMRAGGADRYLKAYNVAYSDDNSNWNIVKSESGLPSKDGIINYEFNSVGKHYYWRLYLQSNNSNQCLNYLGFIAKI